MTDEIPAPYGEDGPTTETVDCWLLEDADGDVGMDGPIYFDYYPLDYEGIDGVEITIGSWEVAV